MVKNSEIFVEGSQLYFNSKSKEAQEFLKKIMNIRASEQQLPGKLQGRKHYTYHFTTSDANIFQSGWSKTLKFFTCAL